MREENHTIQSLSDFKNKNDISELKKHIQEIEVVNSTPKSLKDNEKNIFTPDISSVGIAFKDASQYSSREIIDSINAAYRIDNLMKKKIQNNFTSLITPFFK